MACIKLRSMSAIDECILTLQEQTMSKFVHYNSSKTFTKDWKPSPRGHVYWEWNKPHVQTALIPYDNVPFMFIGHRYMACHQGADAAKNKKHCSQFLKQKRVLIEEDVFFQNKIRTQQSKKVGCPALIRITRIAKFPQYKLTNKVSLGKKREQSRALKLKLLKDPLSVFWEEFFYVCIPSNTEHVGHPIASLSELVEMPFFATPTIEDVVEKPAIRNKLKHRSMHKLKSMVVLVETMKDEESSAKPTRFNSSVTQSSTTEKTESVNLVELQNNLSPIQVVIEFSQLESLSQPISGDYPHLVVEIVMHDFLSTNDDGDLSM